MNASIQCKHNFFLGVGGSGGSFLLKKMSPYIISGNTKEFSNRLKLHKMMMYRLLPHMLVSFLMMTYSVSLRRATDMSGSAVLGSEADQYQLFNSFFTKTFWLGHFCT